MRHPTGRGPKQPLFLYERCEMGFCCRHILPNGSTSRYSHISKKYRPVPIFVEKSSHCGAVKMENGSEAVLDTGVSTDPKALPTIRRRDQQRGEAPPQNAFGRDRATYALEASKRQESGELKLKLPMSGVDKGTLRTIMTEGVKKT